MGKLVPKKHLTGKGSSLFYDLGSYKEIFFTNWFISHSKTKTYGTIFQSLDCA